MQCGLIRSRIDLDPHISYLHSGYDLPAGVGTLYDRNFCKGYLLYFFQGLEYLPLPGEIGVYRDPAFLGPLTYR